MLIIQNLKVSALDLVEGPDVLRLSRMTDACRMAFRAGYTQCQGFDKCSGECETPRKATVSPKSVGDRLLKRWQVLILHNRARIPGEAIVGPEEVTS
jgi:hypothetical protein